LWAVGYRENRSDCGNLFGFAPVQGEEGQGKRSPFVKHSRPITEFSTSVQCESRSVGFRESQLGLPELCRFWELCGFFNSSRGRGAVETEFTVRESSSSAVGPPSEAHN